MNSENLIKEINNLKSEIEKDKSEIVRVPERFKAVAQLEMETKTNKISELENRLEISKMENAALIRNKDEIILDMKRQKDHLVNELENYRTKGQELYKQINEKQETLRRTVKALRLALTLLEGNNDGSGHKAS